MHFVKGTFGLPRYDNDVEARHQRARKWKTATFTYMFALSDEQKQAHFFRLGCSSEMF